LFLGADIVHLEFGLSTSNALEAHLNKWLMLRKSYNLADSTKMNIRGLVKFVI
jgi:DeoR/GlpR family transcriptional regulator of sugar metabolism